MTGTSHLAVGAECQDSHVCTVVRNDSNAEALVVVVSDGAGSAKYGQRGAILTTQTINDIVTEFLKQGLPSTSIDKELVCSWLDNVRDRIATEANSAGFEMRDFAATMLIGIIESDFAVFAQMGDGAIVVSQSHGAWSPVFWPQHGDYANQTYFVTDDFAYQNLMFSSAGGSIREVAAFTDGLERVLLNFSDQTAPAAAFDRMLTPLRNSEAFGHQEGLSKALAAYLISPSVTSKADDDLTLVICTSANASPPVTRDV